MMKRTRIRGDCSSGTESYQLSAIGSELSVVGSRLEGLVLGVWDVGFGGDMGNGKWLDLLELNYLLLGNVGRDPLPPFVCRSGNLKDLAGGIRRGSGE